jgi:subtilisin-like proprotein convertase family protein
MKKLTLVAIFFLNAMLNLAQAQNWKQSKDEQVPMRPQNTRRVIPMKYEVWKVDFQALKNQLDAAPMEMTEAKTPIFITLPLPNGKEATLEVKESPVAHPDLMAKYPTFKTFYGVGGRNKEYSGRFDYTMDGFHAALDTPDGEVYIDPYATEVKNYYVVYFTADAIRPEDYKKMICGTGHGLNKANHVIEPYSTKTNTQSRSMEGDIVKVHKYRLAMGCTGEFVQSYGGTKASALAKMVALVNRTNRVTMGENAIRFELVANTDTLIWLNPKTDPFPNGNLGKDAEDANGVVIAKGILSFSNNAIKQLIGNNNFDVGHIVTMNCSDVGGVVGGLACTTQGKGSGVTCDGSGNTDAIAINIMCHEMAGHQFTGSHTMSSCKALPDKEEYSQVGSSSKIEPGSGSTIMSYDGSCGTDNITGTYWKTNGIYSVGSLGQIRGYAKNSCSTTTEVANHNPVVNVLHQKKGLIIPRFTPFELTATGTDADNDIIKYSWEQSDSGNFKSLGTQSDDSNSFRVFDPVTSPTRTFPKLDNILKEKSTKDELYPDTTRKYTFVCLARDNNPIGGGIGLDTIIFKSTHTAGPFAITFPNVTADTVHTGDYMSVKWNVAKTDNALVNCQYVNILLSRDGGYTYPITLLKNTANDGEEGVILPPDISTSAARIRINPVGNIFFDVSNKNFTIAPTARVGYTVAFNTERFKYCIPDIATFNIQSVSLGGFDKPITLSVDGLPQGATAKFDTETLTPNQNTRLVVDLANVKIQGDYTVKLRAIAGTDTIYRVTKVRGVSVDFSTAGITSPSNGATGIDLLPKFKWTTSPNAETYDIQIASNPSFEKLDTFAYNLKVAELQTPKTLLGNKLYYIRVRGSNNCKAGEWMTPSPFHTLTQICKDYNTKKAFPITSSQPVTVKSEVDIQESGIVNDVNVAIKGSHTNFGDLEIKLISPNGKESLLSNQKCYGTGGKTLNLNYDDESTQVNKCDKLLSTGTVYRPETPLSNLDGENTKGKWTLQIKDVSSGEGGTLDEWTAKLCAATSVQAPQLIKNDTLKVRPNKGRFISDSLLVATDDKATAQQLTYTLLTLPLNGTLERWNGGKLAVGNTFTQAEINQRSAIRYVHGNNTATSDYFLFVITDGEGGFAGTLKYNIVISANAPISATQDAALANAIQVYPNPTANVLNVSIYQTVSQNTKILLFSVSGQQVIEKNLPEGEVATQLETSHLPDGIYLLKVNNLNGFATKRVMVKH